MLKPLWGWWSGEIFCCCCCRKACSFAPSCHPSITFTHRSRSCDDKLIANLDPSGPYHMITSCWSSKWRQQSPGPSPGLPGEKCIVSQGAVLEGCDTEGGGEYLCVSALLITQAGCRDLSVWSLHVLPVSPWVLTSFPGSLPRPKNMHVRWFRKLKFSVGVCESVTACLCLCDVMWWQTVDSSRVSPWICPQTAGRGSARPSWPSFQENGCTDNHYLSNKLWYNDF